MSRIDFEAIENLLSKAHRDGRSGLLEHECYTMLSAIGAEAAPDYRLIPAGAQPTPGDLEAIPGEKIVLKVLSPDITHKTEAKGVRIVAKEMGAVEAAHELMLHQVPSAYAGFLGGHMGEIPESLRGFSGSGLEKRLEKRLVGVLLCRFMTPDAQGFATELFVGIRHTLEFGPIISAGFGGVEMETLARETRKGAAVAIAPTGLVNGAEFLELFKRTLSYQRLSGTMRGARKLVSDAILEECFTAFIEVANHFSENNSEARFHIEEFEVNPFSVVGAHLAPLDGICSFTLATPPAEPRPLHKIGNLLEPSSAAIIGVSAKGMNMGRIILKNILGGGFDPHRAYIVRPGMDELDGVSCVPSIADLPEKVDLFVVAVGAHQVPEVLEDLLDHDKAEAVILIPGGLGEKEGSQDLAHRLQERIRTAHREPHGGSVFIGGNSLGIISHAGRYDTMFIPENKLPKSRGDHRRKTCFISQSGAYIIANLSRMPWFDPEFALSIGNQIDLTASDLLSYIKDDPRIEVFGIYMEGFRPADGLAFARAVQETVTLGKDVVFYKAGRTSEGRSATAGHTASVAGDYAVCEAALEEAGAWVASDFNEFSDLLRLCTNLRGKEIAGNNIAAVSNAGFEAVGMADSIKVGRYGLQLNSFDETISRALSNILEEFKLDGLVDVKNPFDITPMANDEAFVRLVSTILEDPNVDAAVIGIVPLTPALQTLPESEDHRENVLDPRSLCQLLPQVAAKSHKPVVVVVDSGEIFDPMVATIENGGLPVFRSADRAMKALCRWVEVKGRKKS
ncbi:MAG: acetate--CoA ligase family protein [Thermoanaerobaculales bacterium]|nr:acetate--CoA ligase family protein [Thermoanaerobaculales bacterium]